MAEGIGTTEAAIAAKSLPPGAKITPMLRQWLDAKVKAKDAVLLFRMGDFYELFGDDATTAAPVLDLALTSRDKDKDNALPMAGFPHHQAPLYIAKLIAAGMKVAVCDQMEDPALARGIVKRDVTRIVTPGMVLDAESLDAKANNFLVAVVGGGDDGDGVYGVAAVDVSTGEVVACVVDGNDALLDELARLAPREIVAEARITARLSGCAPRVESREPPRDTRAVERLGAPDALLLEHTRKPALTACALALAYIEETNQGRMPQNLLAPRGYATGDQLLLDPTSRAHLDVIGPSHDRRKKGTLLALLDRTHTAMGGRRLMRWLLAPSTQASVIATRHDAIASLLEEPAAGRALTTALSGVTDIERVVGRASAGRVLPRELANLRDALARLPTVAAALPTTPAFASWTKALAPPKKLLQQLTRALVDAPTALGDGDVFARGFDKDLDAIASLQDGGRALLEELEEKERNGTGIHTLKIRYTRVFGYYIEVTKSHHKKVPTHYRRKQTVANGERYVTDDLEALADQVESAQSRRLARERDLYAELVDAVVAARSDILRCAHALADVDALGSLADVARSARWTRPVLLPREERRLRIVEGRHPMVEESAAERRETYVPSSLALDADKRVLVVTGPNMAGKSTLMRQAALIQILAQMGSYVPAREAELSLCDRIYTRVGAADDLAQGRSTFMVEMSETSHILRGATPFSLVLLDEIGRGTSTWDGLSIAWAVAEYIHDVVGCRALFATHYHELTRITDEKTGITNVHVVVKEWNDQIVFVRTLADGAAERSYGIQVARLAGLPHAVLDRARALLADLEAHGKNTWTPSLVPQAARSNDAPQMPLFAPNADVVDPLREKLRAMDVLRMTPLDAMQALAALVKDAQG